MATAKPTGAGSTGSGKKAKQAKKAAVAPALVVARNRKARFNYSLGESFVAGISLKGTEVKALREGRIALDQAFARVDEGEVWLMGVLIPEYLAGSYTNHEVSRRRKLLLNAHEIRKIANGVAEKGKTLVPLDIHFAASGYAKVSLALATGRRQHDKRQAIAKRESDRDIERRR